MSGEVVHLAIEGVGGEYWQIHGPGCERSGVVLDMEPEDLWETPTTTIWKSGAYEEGGTYQGKKNNMLDPVLPVHLSSTPEREWLPTYSLWRKSFDFEKKAYIVATSDSGVRRLGVQLLETPPFRPRIDPGVNGYAPMLMRLRAGWPFWVEEDAIDVFQSGPSNRGARNGVAFYSGSVVLSNPTNQPAYVKWVVEAVNGGKVTLPDFSWIADPEHEDYQWRDRTITTPTLSAGEVLTIDSYPDNETWTSNINPMFYGRTGGIEFEFEIPPYTELTEVPIECTNPGTTVMVRQPRNWRTAMGGE